MKTIERSSAFKRAKAAPRHRNDLDSLVSTVVPRLASDQVLPIKLIAEKHFLRVKGHKLIPLLLSQLEMLAPSKIAVVKRRNAS